MNLLNMSIKYQWKPVVQRENEEYLFPMPITPFMRDRYRGPAVFKWDIYQKTHGDRKMVYIGEAQELCPKRLYSYLSPGQTQLAQKKINSDFREYLKEKLKIRLEICDLDAFSYNGSEINREGLSSKWVRRLIVAALVLDEQKRGVNVLDL